MGKWSVRWLVAGVLLGVAVAAVAAAARRVRLREEAIAESAEEPDAAMV